MLTIMVVFPAICRPYVQEFNAERGRPLIDYFTLSLWLLTSIRFLLYPSENLSNIVSCSAGDQERIFQGTALFS